MTQLVGHLRPSRGPRVAKGVLTVGHPADERHGQPAFYFPEPAGPIVLRAGQQTAGQQDLARQAVPQNPQHLVANVRLQPVQGQDHPAWLRQEAAPAPAVGQPEGHQFSVPIQPVGHAALAEANAPRD